MKYLIVPLYHPSVLKGGAQYVAKDLHDAAAADPGVEATMLAAIDAHMFPQYNKTGAAITGLSNRPDEYLLLGLRFDDFYNVSYDPRRNKAIRRFLEEINPDVIHVHHSIWIGLDFLMLVREILPDVRIVYTLHEYLAICYARGQLYRYRERRICRDTAPDQCVKCFPDRTEDEFILRRRGFMQAFGLVDHFIAPSDHLRDRFIDWGIAPERISTIANGHRRKRPEKWQPVASEALNRFGYFGQFVDAKGIDIALRAAAIVAADVEVEILLFGGNKELATPEYRETIAKIIEDAGENLKVTELGEYSRDNVFDLMCLVDWVVMPSIWPETFGLVISEAWDARRPVIGSQVGAIGDRIQDGVNGRTFASENMQQLAQIMREHIGNQTLWKRLVGNIRDEISVDAAWKAHKEVFEGLLAAQKKSAHRTSQAG